MRNIEFIYESFKTLNPICRSLLHMRIVIKLTFERRCHDAEEDILTLRLIFIYLMINTQLRYKKSSIYKKEKEN